MTPEVASLHWAALRYCNEWFSHWAGVYSRGAWTNADREGIYPRYNVLNAIRIDLERLTGSDLKDLEQARELFATAGMTAEDASTKTRSQMALAAMAEERAKFAAFIREVTHADLDAIAPLPYIRVLTEEEAGRIWSKVQASWGLTRRCSWYPLDKTTRSDIAAFQVKYFDLALPADHLRQILSEHGVARVFEFREYGSEREMDVSAFEAYYSGAEGFWTSSRMDWIVYASHESSITVGGWLLQAVRDAWPESTRHEWTTSFFD